MLAGNRGYLLEQHDVEQPQPAQVHFWPPAQQSQFWHWVQVHEVQHCVLAAGVAGAAAAV